MSDTSSARRGRPRGFDRDEALAQALELFWAHGYEATTLTELQRAMGINAPSFYAAFGSKEQLFAETIDLYAESECGPMTRAIAEAPTARAAIEGLLRAATISFRQPGKPRGCFIVLGATTCSEANADVVEVVRARRRERHTVIEQRLRRGIADGDVPRTIDVRATATYYTTVVDGLAIEARDGASRRTLQAVVDFAMATWDVLVGPASAPGDHLSL